MNIFKLVIIIAILMGLNLLEALPLQLPASGSMDWISASIKKLLALRQWSGWITPTSGVLLVGFGVISLLSRLVPIS